MIYSISNDTPNGKIDLESLNNEIRASNITIALGSASQSGDTLEIIFKAPISSSEEDILNLLISNHSGTPLKQEVIQKVQNILSIGGQKKTDRGFKFTAIAGQETIYDYKVLESLYIKEGLLFTSNQDTHDSVTMELVDKDYIYAGTLYAPNYNGLAWSLVQPNGVVLHRYIGNYPVSPDGKTTSENEALSELDMKDLYIRVIYESTGSTDVKCNVGIRAYS